MEHPLVIANRHYHDQVYGRHGRRHGLTGRRPNRIFMQEPAYRQGYALGRLIRWTGTMLYAASFLFIAWVIIATIIH